METINYQKGREKEKEKEKEKENATSNPSHLQSQSSPKSTQLTKLDAVLFHFYSKTSSLITQSRLSHYSLGNSVDESQSTGSGSSRRQASGSDANHARKASKWFAIELEDTQVFKDELRLWKSISDLIPTSPATSSTFTSSNFASSTSNASTVPPMIIDILLDPSFLKQDQTLYWTSDDGRKVRIADILDSETATESDSKEQKVEGGETKPIVLESWRLDFIPSISSSPPELPTLYKRSITHFRSLFTLSRTLPTHDLYEKFRSESSRNIRDGLRLGCRIGLGESTEERGEMQEIPLEKAFGESHGETLVDTSENRIPSHLKVHQFNQILTPIGNLDFKVTYRDNVNFSVGDLEASNPMKEIEMDEDFFRPGKNKVSPQDSTNPLNAMARPPPPSSASSFKSPTIPQPSRPLSSISADRRATIPSTTNHPPGSSSIEQPSSSPKAPVPSSLFSTSAPGRPIAGLSNLRRTGSSSAGTNIGLTNTTPSTSSNPSTPSGSFPGSSTPPSPALATALGSADPAFLAHGRRASSSEKRIRTISSINPEKASPSPPSSSLTGSNQQNQAGFQGIRQSNYASLRTGSYSPSSPSPLAQQMTSAESSSVDQAKSRIGIGGATASLRSIFQSYAPSSSTSNPNSSLSISRTSPKSIFSTRGSGNDFHPPSPLSAGTGTSTASEHHHHHHHHRSSSIGMRDSPTSTPSDEVPPAQTSSTSTSNSVSSFRKPTVAPQMIKRYSSTFSYRSGSGRQYSGSLGGAGTEGGNSAQFLTESGSGSLESSENQPFSRSWTTRLEQRYGLGSRSIGREEGTNFASRYARSQQAESIPSQDEEINDFVRMIDSRAQLSSSIRSNNSVTGDSFSSHHHRNPSNVKVSSSIKGGNSPLSRSQVDTMLSKMANSLQISPGSGGSGSPQGTGGGVAETSSPAHARSPLALGAIAASGGSPLIGASGGGGDGELSSVEPTSIARRSGNHPNSPIRARSSLLHQQHRSSGSNSGSHSQDFHFSYDDEDETAGRLELNQEDYLASSESNRTTELERRKADADLVRNFGEDLSSIRGKGRISRSPWRRDQG